MHGEGESQHTGTPSPWIACVAHAAPARCSLCAAQTVEYDSAAAPFYNVVVSGSIGHAPIDAEAWQITKLPDGTSRRGTDGPPYDGRVSAHGSDAGSVGSDTSALSKTQRKKLARREWRAERRRKKQAAAAAARAAEAGGASASSDAAGAASAGADNA